MQEDSNIRFADYFFRAGISPITNLLETKLPENIIADVELQETENENKKEPHPLTNRYEPDTIYRYPKTDYSENDKFPAYTPMVIIIDEFCFPNDILFVSQDNGKPPDTFHSFVREFN